MYVSAYQFFITFNNLLKKGSLQPTTYFRYSFFSILIELGVYRGTVLPWFTRLLWQIKNRVNQNSRYTSPSMDKMIVQKMSKKFL